MSTFIYYLLRIQRSVTHYDQILVKYIQEMKSG